MRKTGKLIVLCFVLVTLSIFAAFVLLPHRDTQPSTSADRYAQRLIRVGFSQVDLTESDWRIANTASMREALSRENGFELILVDAQNDPDKQLADVVSLIRQNVDYIVIATVQERGWENVLQQAKDAGIPVILVDRSADVSPDLFVSWIGTNSRDEGAIAVRWLQDFRGSDVRAVHLQGLMGSSAQIGRTEMFVNAAAANDWTILASMTANWDMEQARYVMQNWLVRFPGINVVYAENDNMAEGAVQAIVAAGLVAGGYDGITVISFDANRRFLQMAFDTGKINFNVECNPLHGPRVAEIINALERGETVPRVNYVTGGAFDWRYLTQEIIDARQY